MLKHAIQALLAALTLAGTSPAFAQQPVSLGFDVKVEKTVQNDDGTTVTALVDPEVTIPGDRLVYGINYTNSGTEPVENFVVTNPLPKPVRLADDADPALVVSVDGGATWGTLAELQVADAEGVTRAATAADVTHIRWTLALVEPGESGRLEYRAVIR
jgi:uncharacterized repeat protein (TIGR01451 family)